MEYTVKELLKEVNSAYSAPGDERARAISEHVIGQIFETIEKFDISHDEVWAFVRWMNSIGQSNQTGLLLAGIGVERVLDILADEKDKKAGLELGTARAIEGPLYVSGAPVQQHFARLDDGTESGEVLIFEGKVCDLEGKPIPHATVEVWQANQQGTYSIIDPTQSPYNYRRTIITDANGHYVFRTLVPPGYAVPEGSPTDVLMKLLGRHGQRPAHIHFMVHANGYKKLTTQINWPEDKYIQEDFAFATRDELIVEPKKVSDEALIKKYELDAPFTHVSFDFKVQKD